MVIALLRILAAADLCLALWNLYVARLLWKEKHCASTVAKLTDVRSKENVRVRKHGVSGPFVTVPHSSTGTYVYTVGGKDYRIKGWQHIAPGKLPKQPRVVYLKRFPKHAYLDCELMHLPELLRSFMSLMLSVGLWVLAQGLADGSIVW